VRKKREQIDESRAAKKKEKKKEKIGEGGLELQEQKQFI